MTAILASSTIEEVVLTVFGAGLGTGFIIFLTANAISSALKIFKNV